MLLKGLLNKIKSKWLKFQQKLNPKTWQQRSIVYYTGHTSYEWTPENLKVGIGGSESAIIFLAREWSRLGYQVTVYNNCGSLGKIYDGVEYIHYSQFNPYDKFDTLIIWRYPWRLDSNTKANRIFLDIHEVLLPEQVTPQKLGKFDKIFVKSQYHRSLLPEIPDSKIAIITNGADTAYLEYISLPKEPYKIIYASNYIRGLERMLLWGWPIIKKEVPEANLDIYYGWHTLDESKPENREWKAKMIELMEQPGVREHGRIGVDKLLEEKATSAIHYYGCTFQEIDCISVRESAMVGCVPVTTDYVALSEKDYCVKVAGNPYEKDIQESIAYQIVELLKNPEKLAEIRESNQKLVRKETWENIAKTWLLNWE
ncbi:MAG: glycosyltransferase family 4 protein [Okeania sp. SIO3I5]|uniref:glycosyltransferase family 1 protein n=1 Tax=Okeania sp. SIO3I5 TaxID=2607805 RepID=UPI0013BC19BB|nr:glycosyltransferase family 1 protein [Okeania sp. SIO3I5]NEQ36352.1 glycosyltransferase family 4 protein [Okeania sp. SIO3I5]